MRSNPFETIKGAIFQNRYTIILYCVLYHNYSHIFHRAAMKMANINAVFGFMFTDPQLEPVCNHIVIA